MLFGSNLLFLTKVKQYLIKIFGSKDIGDAKYILSIKSKYITKGIELF